MRVTICDKAYKDLAKINKKDANRILSKMMTLEDLPNAVNVKKLVNFQPAYRLRVGNYRILFDVKKDKILVARVLDRKHSY